MTMTKNKIRVELPDATIELRGPAAGIMGLCMRMDDLIAHVREARDQIPDSRDVDNKEPLDFVIDAINIQMEKTWEAAWKVVYHPIIYEDKRLMEISGEPTPEESRRRLAQAVIEFNRATFPEECKGLPYHTVGLCQHPDGTGYAEREVIAAIDASVTQAEIKKLIGDDPKDYQDQEIQARMKQMK
jgi:hypothetical protein